MLSVPLSPGAPLPTTVAPLPRLLDWYMEGELKLDELVTTTYTLDQVNQGYKDMLDGKNLRGIITYEEA